MLRVALMNENGIGDMNIGFNESLGVRATSPEPSASFLMS